MLQAIRSKAGSFAAKILFGLLILTFGIWGIGDIFRNHAPDTVVATVGSDSIRAEELQTALQPQLDRLRARLGALDMQQAKQFGIVDTVLAELIDRRLLDQEANHLRLDLSDDVVRSAVYDNPTFRGPDGQFDRSLFNQILAMNRISEDQYIARIRAELPRSDLVHALTTGAVGPQEEIDALYRYHNEKRVADIVALPASAAGDVGTPSDADLTKFYDAHDEQFRAPEYRGFTLLSLSPDDLAHDITIPEARLKSEYDERQDEFQTPERREVQQILSPSEAKAKEALAAVAAGKDWTEIAKGAGMDPDTIDLGLLKRSEMPKVLADIAFGLALNTPSAPVETPLGWHVLRVVKIDPAATQSFDEAKPKLTAELARNEAADQIDKVGNKIDDAIAGGASLAEAAAKFKLKTTTVKEVDVGGRDRDGKPVALPVARDDVLKAAFATDKGTMTRVSSTQDGAIFVLRTDSVVASHIRPLAEVKDKAIAAWQADQKKLKVAKEAADLAAAVKPDAPLAALAKEKGLTVTTSPPLLRQADPNTPVPPALVARLFDAKKDGVVTGEDATGSYVAQLKEIQAAPAPPKTATADLSHALDSAWQSDVAIEFAAALRKRFPVKIEHDTLDHLF